MQPGLPWLLCLAAAILAGLSSGALAACDRSAVPVGDVNILLRSSLKLEDLPRSPGYYKILIENVVIRPGIENHIYSEISKNIPASNCQSRYTPHSYTTKVTDGKLQVGFAVKYEKWVCIRTDGFCTKGLEVYKCDWESKNKLLDKTVNFSAILSPRFDGKTVRIDTSVTNDASSDALEVVASALLPIGTPLFLRLADNFRNQFQPFASTTSIPNLSIPADIKDVVDQLEPEKIEFAYSNRNPDQYSMRIFMGSTKPEETACFVRKRLHESYSKAECARAREIIAQSDQGRYDLLPPKARECASQVERSVDATKCISEMIGTTDPNHIKTEEQRIIKMIRDREERNHRLLTQTCR